MLQLIVGSAVMSFLHALLPNHWLPVISIGRKEKWTLRQTLIITLIAGGAHALSTILIGIGIGFLGFSLASWNVQMFQYIGSALLILMGIVFIYRHHTHAHFQVAMKEENNQKSLLSYALLIFISMLFSPCLEISAYFLMAGSHGWNYVWIIALIYLFCTTLGMFVWVWWMYPKVERLDWHALEHKTGIISGWVLIISGVLSMLL